MRRMSGSRVAVVIGLALVCSLAAIVGSISPAVGAGGDVFTATLSGTSVVPPNVSPATGTATVTLDPTQTSISINVSFSGLTGTTTAAHIHGPAAAGTNAAVVFTIPTLVGFPLGVTSGTYSNSGIAITAPQLADLEAGLYYFDIHSSAFAGGELRGQLALVVAPPTTVAPAAPTVIQPRFTG